MAFWDKNLKVSNGHSGILEFLWPTRGPSVARLWPSNFLTPIELTKGLLAQKFAYFLHG